MATSLSPSPTERIEARRSAFADFRVDAARYVYYDDPEAAPTFGRIVRAILAHQGLQAVALYRFGRFLEGSRRRGFLTRLLLLPARLCYPVLSRLNDIVNGIWISRAARIGPGLFIAHSGGVVIGPCDIGANCNLGHAVTIGKGGRGERAGNPVIGDRVVIAVGACVLGRVTIGEDAMVGANSVVTRDVPARAVVSGIPAKAVSSDGSFDYLEYPEMAQDAARARSFAERM